ncbi:pentatricopeptide repeat-containing mitochondrial-like [Brachionus plicatilis]|uniref:Pentatricopeptide repeat-containing mitochondrial-like n=1 Tax=Brachionus plicatilis TaxID=10195 RepID=A0A3M7RSU6_BRAPC|nr:pentatricopeptide repeat-containing mitochondrial-like [Brachionus plicatilis]
MLSSIVRALPRLNISGSYLTVQSARTFFTPAHFGIDSFKNYASNIERDQGKNASSLKVTIEEAVSKPDGKIFTEDLKTLLYLSKSDSDLDLLVNAIRKYQKQESTAIFGFNFETPLIRLLYSLNKTDRALALFLDENDSVLKRFYTAGTILMNKLLEEKRYEDSIKVVNKMINKFKQDKKSDPNSRLRTMDITNLATEALLGINNADALSHAKKMLIDFKELNLEIHDNAYIKLILLAHNQNQIDFAYELTSLIKNKNQNIINNLKFLSLIRLDRIDDAIQIAEDTNKIVLERGIENRLFFKETLAVLVDLAGKLEGEKKDRVQDLVTTIKQEKKLIDLSLNDYALRLREDRKQNQQNQQRQQGQPMDRQRQQNQRDQQRQQGQQSRQRQNRTQREENSRED